MTGIDGMAIQMKSILILLGTLLIGGVLGGTLVGTISQNRKERREEIRGPGGFVRHMERVIGIEDSVQHAAIHPILEEADRRNREAIKGVRQQMAASFDTMLTQLQPYLSQEQLENLQQEREHMKRRMNDPRGPGGPPPGIPGHPPGE